MTPFPSRLPLVVAFGVAMMLAATLLSVPGSQADAQQSGPTICSLSVVDGAVLSPAATPKLFPNGAETMFLRGRVGSGATIVQVRIEDFWSGREWHPNTDCREAQVARTCPDGSMATGMRFSRADINPQIANGTKAFTYRAQLPNGMYRINVIARRNRTAAPGVVYTRWFRVNRSATTTAAQAQIISRNPANTAVANLTDRFERTPIRVVGNTVSTRLHWALRENSTGRFYQATQETLQECPDRWGCRFQAGTFFNRRDFDGWQSAQGGRVFFDWSLPLLPGDYTMWIIGVNSNGKKGSTFSHSFSVASPSIPKPTISLADGEVPTGSTLIRGTSGDSASAEASPEVSLSLYDVEAKGFVTPDGTIGRFEPLGAISGPANDWVARLDLSPGTYQLKVRSTWPDGRILQSAPKEIVVGNCPAAGCSRAELGAVDIDVQNRNFDFDLETTAFTQNGSGKWALFRESNGRWFNANSESFASAWTLNDLEARSDGTAGPAEGTPEQLARGDYFLGLRLFNGAGEEGDVRWIGFTVS